MTLGFRAEQISLRLCRHSATFRSFTDSVSLILIDPPEKLQNLRQNRIFGVTVWKAPREHLVPLTLIFIDPLEKITKFGVTVRKDPVHDSLHVYDSPPLLVW